MSERRALIVGIDEYDPGYCEKLECACADAERVADLLERNDDGTKNFTTRLLLGRGGERVTRSMLRQQWIELFEGFTGDALFYFSGHGASSDWGGYLVSQDGSADEPGVSMDDLLVLANRSKARDVVLILDCCHSGALGNPSILSGLGGPLAMLREGVTVVAASRPHEASFEANGSGLFTDAIAEGLAGGAADHMGNVTAASLFLYAERLFDAWSQRPVYKSHTSTVSTIRRCNPAVALEVLRKLKALFALPETQLRLDPDYEADATLPGLTPERRKKIEDGRVFKQLRDARLLESVESPDLYWAAMNATHVRLTQLGRYFWRLLDRGVI